jgi:mono/diheme cytochrome c family protein
MPRFFQELPKRGLAPLTLLAVLVCSVTAAQEPLDFFEQRVRPILVEHCYQCHGADQSSGGLRLDARAGWQSGGEHGPAVTPGRPETSLLIKAIRYTDKELQMPPPDEGGQLTDRQIADLETWVRLGAPDPRSGGPSAPRDRSAARSHWAFQPIRRPVVPAGQHPIDCFVDQQLAEQNFKALPTADRRTLTRRAAYDLHGLSPSQEQREVAASDFETFVDELLASPRYGERWGRHWLDVARYADAKDGVLMYGDKRIRPFAYTYRDYVIRSFNADKPMDRFIHEQLAGDLLGLSSNAPELAALGFLTLGRMFDNNRHDVIDDQIDTLTRGLLGLTVSCARCHDHKFDPIPTADYYSLYGVFANCVEPFERPRIEPPSEQGRAFETDLAEKTDAVRRMQSEQQVAIQATARSRTTRYLIRVATTKPDINETTIFFLSLLPEQLRPPIVHRWRQLIAQRAHPDDPVFGPWYDLIVRGRVGREATAESPRLDELAETWRQRGIDGRVIAALIGSRPATAEDVARIYGQLLIDTHQSDAATPVDPLRGLLSGESSPTWFPKSQVWHYMSRKEKDKYRGMVNELDLIAVQAPHAAARAMALVDSEERFQPVVFRRGDPTQPGEPVPRRFLEVIAGAVRQPFSRGSGRLDLARAVTHADNPLTARVLANRVWMHHFGEPLVESPDDFGLRTAAPSHPQLLDFLASELIRNEWRLKPLHRLIMTSQTYQRASMIPDSGSFAKQQEADPSNRWLWRANRRRLDLEAMRDTLLLVSAQLDATMYGRSSPISDPGNVRRTIYATVERQSIPAVVRNFDFASPDASVARRNVTTVPQQALFALNSEFMTRAARQLATRVDSLASAQRVEALYQLVFGRPANKEEVELGLDFTERSSWEEYTQVLLMTNELMFVD